jgi:hypothetical protein
VLQPMVDISISLAFGFSHHDILQASLIVTHAILISMIDLMVNISMPNQLRGSMQRLKTRFQQQFPHPLESGSGPRGLIGVFVNAIAESPGYLLEPKTFFRSISLFAGQARMSCVC